MSHDSSYGFNRDGPYRQRPFISKRSSAVGQMTAQFPNDRIVLYERIQIKISPK